MIIPVEIRGVRCRVRVTHYMPGQEPIISGNPDNWDPGWPAEIEFEVLGLDGQPAPWLERDMDDADVRAVEQEIIAAKEAEQRDAALAMAEWGAYA